MSNDTIRKVQASIEKLHGDQRARDGKYENFLAWQIRIRQQAQGKEPSPILKTTHPADVR